MPSMPCFWTQQVGRGNFARRQLQAKQLFYGLDTDANGRLEIEDFRFLEKSLCFQSACTSGPGRLAVVGNFGRNKYSLLMQSASIALQLPPLAKVEASRVFDRQPERRGQRGGQAGPACSLQDLLESCLLGITILRLNAAQWLPVWLHPAKEGLAPGPR